MYRMGQPYPAHRWIICESTRPSGTVISHYAGSIREKWGTGWAALNRLSQQSDSAAQRQRHQPMRIAFFLNEFPALSQPFILNQITGMIDRGHEVDIYAAQRFQTDKCHPQIEKYALLDKTRFFSDIPAGYLRRLWVVIGLVLSRGAWWRPVLVLKAMVEFDGGRTGLNMRLLYRVLALVDRQAYDIIHCQFGTQGPCALKLKQLGATNGSIVTSFRGYDVTRVLAENPVFYDELFRKGSLFLPVSRNLADRLRSAGCPADRIEVLHSGIDCTRFTFSERHKSKKEVTRLLGIGRLVRKKGWVYAVEAVANARRAGCDIHFTLVGDGELRHEVETAIDKYQLRDWVTLSGWCDHDEVTQFLRESHILIAPSITTEDGDQEGIPNVLKEAMATGLPVLSTWHSGIPELVEDEVTGYLVPEADVERLSERLIQLCDHPEQWAEMSRDARMKIEAEFDTEKINSRLEQLYLGVSADWC